MFEPSDPAQERFKGYGPSALPNKRDDDVTSFVTGVMSRGAAGVNGALVQLSERGRQVLRAYAERMASMAVRSGDRSHLVRALVAVVLGGLDENRLESLIVMAPIEDAAHRIGVNPSDLFELVSEVVGHPATVNLALWLTRKEEDRALASMGFVADEDSNGFRYKLAL